MPNHVYGVQAVLVCIMPYHVYGVQAVLVGIMPYHVYGVQAVLVGITCVWCTGSASVYHMCMVYRQC